MMFWRGVVLLFGAVLLTGCAAQRTGFDYAGVMQKVGPPKPGQSRIVVLHEKSSSLAYCVCDMQLDGVPIGKLKPGTYVYADSKPGRHQLTASEALFPGTTQSDIGTESGRTQFFAVRTSERHNAVTGMAVFGGLAGALVTSAVTAGSQNPGPVDIFRLDEATARTAIAELQLAE
jgi:Protein of unknown function (DUF2846)